MVLGTTDDNLGGKTPIGPKSDNGGTQEIPQSGKKVRCGVLLALVAGLTVSTFLIVYHSFAAVGRAVWSIGWGLSIIVAIHLIAIVFCGAAWHLLFPPGRTVQTKLLIGLRWIRESVNTLLPVARIGGDIVGIRLLLMRGIKVNIAGASIVADRTTEVLSQFLFAVAGVVLLIGSGVNQDYTRWLILGLIVTVPLLAAFLLAQRLGLLRVMEKGIIKFIRRWGGSHDSDSAGVHDALWTIYADGRRLSASTLWHTLGWLSGVVQIWLALNFMGHAVKWSDAFIIESLSQVVCTAAFVMPAALGAQEAGYMVLGGLFGIPPQLGLALSLIKRVSDILVGIPGLLLWQSLEGRRLWALLSGRRSEIKTSSTR